MNNSIAHITVVLSVFLFSCGQPNNNTTKQHNYLAIGDSIALAAQATLVAQLSSAINEGGTTHAVVFCSENALNIKQMLSEKYNCTIERISEKYRNPKDQPANEKDVAVLKSFTEKHLNGETLLPDTVTVKNATVFYKPIMIGMPTCLKCHGNYTTDIDAEIQQILAEKYPNDRATGYKLGDFRGAWKITFSK